VLSVFGLLLGHPALALEDRPAVEQAVAGLRAGLDFADALHHASCRDCEAIATFEDRGFAHRIRSLPPRVVIPSAGSAPCGGDPAEGVDLSRNGPTPLRFQPDQADQS
jgi:hypothetical protein